MSVVAMHIISAAASSIHANSSWHPRTNNIGNAAISQCNSATAIIDICLIIAFALICIALAIYVVRDYRRINTKRPTPMTIYNNQPLTLPTTHDTNNTNDDTYNPYNPHKSLDEYRYIPIRDEEYYAE